MLLLRNIFLLSGLLVGCQSRSFLPPDPAASGLKRGPNYGNIHIREITVVGGSEVRDRVLSTDNKKYRSIIYSLSPEGNFAEVFLDPTSNTMPLIARIVTSTGLEGFINLAKSALVADTPGNIKKFRFIPPFKTQDGVCANPFLSDHYREVLKSSEPGDFWVGILDHRNCSIHVALAAGPGKALRTTLLQNGKTAGPLGPIDASVTAHQLLAQALEIPMTNARQGYVEGDASGFTLQFDGMTQIQSGENTPYFRLISRSGFNSYFYSRLLRFQAFYGPNPSNALARSLPDEVRNSLVWAFLYRNIALRLDRAEAQPATGGEALIKAQEFVDRYRSKTTP